MSAPTPTNMSDIGEDAKKTNDPLALLFGLNKTTIDYTKAFALCHAGVSAGSTPNSNLARSLSLLAQCYYWGMGVAEDREKSIAVWRMHGCDALPPSLMSMVFGDSASWVKMSEDKKKAAVAQAAADCKFGPDESDPDPYSAVSMCVLTPPKKNKRDVQLHIASTITNTLYPYAIKRLRQAADQGDAHAQFFVGMCYSGGYGVERDDHESLSWFKRAADQGHARAKAEYGVLGHQLDQLTPEEAFETYLWDCLLCDTAFLVCCRRAAHIGCREAQRLVAVCYLEGVGVAANQEECRRWMVRAAKAGDLPAIGVIHGWMARAVGSAPADPAGGTPAASAGGAPADPAGGTPADPTANKL